MTTDMAHSMKNRNEEEWTNTKNRCTRTMVTIIGSRSADVSKKKC